MAGATETNSAAEVSSEIDPVVDRPTTNLPEETAEKTEATSDHAASGSDAESESPDDQDEQDSETENANGRDSLATREKRERKKVQRLSETWNRAHVEQVEQKAKIVKELISALETGSGTPLGDIPIIEAAFRKTKPVNLKVLHMMIYNRPGTATEIRTNLRKFRGFGFSHDSEQYQKKINQFQHRTTSELREALRLLNLEVSGSRDQLIERLMEFFLKPSANMVKYKGKLPPKSSRARSRSTSKNKAKGKPRTHKTASSKATSSEVSGDVASGSGTDDDDNDDEHDSLSDAGGSSHSEQSDEEESPKRAPKKRGRPAGKSTQASAAPKQTKKKRPGAAELTDSDSDQDEKADAKPPVSKRSKAPQKTTSADSDEDAPLSTLAPPKSGGVPSDSELKRTIIDLLKTVNLEETSLKVVREQIFSRYPGVDLTNKKEFINTTVKEYLAQS